MAGALLHVFSAIGNTPVNGVRAPCSTSSKSQAPFSSETLLVNLTDLWSNLKSFGMADIAKVLLQRINFASSASSGLDSIYDSRLHII